MNMPASSRVTVRKATSCATIDMDAFSVPWTQEPEPGTEMFHPTGVPDDTYRYYFMGPSVLGGYTLANFTFIVSNYSLFVNGLPYTFNTRTSYAKNFTEGGFFPVPALNRTDPDVTIFTLNNHVAYTGEVFDPLYYANTQSLGNRLANAWVSNSTLTGLACTEQYQFCNPSLPDPSARCTPMASMYEFDLVIPASSLDLTPRQAAIYRILRSTIYFMRTNMVVTFLKNEVLLANKIVYGSFGISTMLSDTQWHLGVENLHNITMAGLQANMISHASEPEFMIRPGLNLLDHIDEETDPDSPALCRNQRVKVTRYSSSSMLGVLVIVIVSAIIILTDMCLPRLVARSSRYKKIHALGSGGGPNHPLSAWNQDDVLQLQRQALELRGVGPWQRHGKGKVPVTEGWDVRFKRTGDTDSNSNKDRDGPMQRNRDNKVYSGIFRQDDLRISNEAFEPLTREGDGMPRLHGSPRLQAQGQVYGRELGRGQRLGCSQIQGHGDAVQLEDMSKTPFGSAVKVNRWI